MNQQATPKTTYRGLFEVIRTEMAAIAPRQSPQVEGAVDRMLFGGDVVVAPIYFRVTERDSAGLVYVGGGWLQGLTQGSVVGFFPPESREPAHDRPWATGTVAQSGTLASAVKPDATLTEHQLNTAWVYILEENPGDLRIRLLIKPFNGNLYGYLREKFAKIPVIELSNDQPDLILEQEGSDLLLVTNDDQTLLSIPANSPPPPAERKLLQEIKNYGQVRFLRNLNALSREIKVNLDIIPVQLNDRTGAETARIPLAQKTNAQGTLVLREGDFIKVRVTNSGTIPAYFTLLDLQPDYQFSVLVPGDKETPEEFRVGPGESMEVSTVFSIGPPYGLEMFKLIATSNPVDFRPIAGSRGTSTRANDALSPLEKMFGDTFYNDDVMTRGGKVHRLSAGTVAVVALPFTIAP